LKNGADVNAGGEKYDNALQAASAKGFENIFQLVFGKRANFNFAVAGWNEVIIRLLKEKGADVNAVGGNYVRQVASANWRANIVQLLSLLENGANLDAVGRNYSSVLQGASTKGRENIGPLLSEEGADDNA
ncbi:hypothetical protein B0H19DRAFT_847154, partial [Mycena capillaripes]